MMKSPIFAIVFAVTQCMVVVVVVASQTSHFRRGPSPITVPHVSPYYGPGRSGEQPGEGEPVVPGEPVPAVPSEPVADPTHDGRDSPYSKPNGEAEEYDPNDHHTPFDNDWEDNWNGPSNQELTYDGKKLRGEGNIMEPWEPNVPAEPIVNPTYGGRDRKRWEYPPVTLG